MIGPTDFLHPSPAPHLFLQNVLHVSGGSSTHHQELKHYTYSIRYLSSRYCYLSLSWRSWQKIKACISILYASTLHCQFTLCQYTSLPIYIMPVHFTANLHYVSTLHRQFTLCQYTSLPIYIMPVHFTANFSSMLLKIIRWFLIFF
jgi:hypothetical protein